MATIFDEASEEARKRKAAENLSLEEQGKMLSTDREGRRQIFEDAASNLARTSKEAPDEIMRATEESTAKALGASPSKDLRTLQGVAEEAHVGGKLKSIEAKQQAAAQMMDVAVAAEEMGSEVEDYSAQLAEYTVARNAIIDKHKGFWNDDESAMYTELMQYSEDPTLDPKLKTMVIAQAEDIKSKKWNV